MSATNGAPPFRVSPAGRVVAFATTHDRQKRAIPVPAGPHRQPDPATTSSPPSKLPEKRLLLAARDIIGDVLRRASFV